MLIKKILYIILKILFRNKEVSLPLDIVNFKKVLILRYDKIGDMIITTPYIQIFKNFNPACQIDFLASQSNSKILQNDNFVGNVFIFPVKTFLRLKLLLKMRKEKYELAISLVYSKTTFGGILSNLAAPDAIKVTFAHESRKNLYSALFNVLIDKKEFGEDLTLAKVQVLMLCRLFNLQFSDELLKFRLILSDNDKTGAENFMMLKQEGLKIIFNISAGVHYRTLSAEKNIEILDELLKSLPVSDFIITCSPDDLKKAEIIYNYFQGKIDLFPPSNNILELAALISLSDIVVTPDTSVVHICSCYGKKILAFYTSYNTANSLWMPANVLYKPVFTTNGEFLEKLDIKEIVKEFHELIDL